MRILKILKGFITNSSSTNYYVEEEMTEEETQGHIESLQATAEATPVNQPIETTNSYPRESLIGGAVLLFFALIALIVYWVKLSKK